MVIKAIGEEKQADLFKRLFPALELDERGVVVRNPETGQTSISARVLPGGDCANGGREVVNAVAEGKKAARGIHAFLAGQQVAGPSQPSRFGVKGPAGRLGLRPADPGAGVGGRICQPNKRAINRR